jgi:outer membrane biosynthesis protein TonB
MANPSPAVLPLVRKKQNTRECNRKVEESTSAAPEPEPEAVEVVAEVPPVAAKAPAVKPPPVVPEPAKATAPSEGILKSTEKAKEVVQKVGVKETKERMSSKEASSSSSSVGSSTPAKPPAAAAEQKKAEVVAVTEKKDGRGGRVAKGLTLIAAAGLVALVRNVVKAYLGRGML